MEIQDAASLACFSVLSFNTRVLAVHHCYAYRTGVKPPTAEVRFQDLTVQTIVYAELSPGSCHPSWAFIENAWRWALSDGCTPYPAQYMLLLLDASLLLHCNPDFPDLPCSGRCNVYFSSALKSATW